MATNCFHCHRKTSDCKVKIRLLSKRQCCQSSFLCNYGGNKSTFVSSRGRPYGSGLMTRHVFKSLSDRIHKISGVQNLFEVEGNFQWFKKSKKNNKRCLIELVDMVRNLSSILMNLIQGMNILGGLQTMWNIENRIRKILW